MSMADKVHKAEELKLEGNEAFKAGNLKLAKKKYLSIFLYIKGLVRRDGSDPMHGFFSAMGANANYGSNEITDLELDSKVKNLTRDANTNLSLVFAKLENWEKSLKHANDALQVSGGGERKWKRAQRKDAPLVCDSQNASRSEPPPYLHSWWWGEEVETRTSQRRPTRV